MQVTRQITNDITYVGVSDRRLSLLHLTDALACICSKARRDARPPPVVI